MCMEGIRRVSPPGSLSRPARRNTDLRYRRVVYMKSLRRFYIPNALYFITAVTNKREPLLLEEPSLFHEAWGRQKIFAWVILPDHFHVLLRPAGHTISHVMHHFKVTYSRQFRDKYRPGPVWQKRFWDHVIRDAEDLRRHLDYIHYNPVKHRLCETPGQYALSSFEQFLARGYYDQEWGQVSPEFEGEFGE